MAKIFLILFLLMISVSSAQNYSLDLVGRIYFQSNVGSDTSGGSDVWGYTDENGNDYAIMGTYDGISFVEVPSMNVINEIPGPQLQDYYYHRDIKTYKHYAYEVSENRGTNEGLMIMDLQYLPDSVHFIKSYVSGENVRSHNFSIDTANGFAYILAQNYTGFRIVDLSDPENPVETGFVNTPSIHDVYARNDTVYVAEGFQSSFSIYDVSDKTNGRLIVRWETPTNGYAHNIWPSDDGKFVMTTEETLDRTVKYWDVSDPENVILRGEYLGENNLAHNTHIIGNFAYLSHYRYGIAVLDISNPDSLKEIASYNTYYGPRTGLFYGCWGAFPFTKNGYIYASDIEGYLTVLKFTEVTSGINDETIPEDYSLTNYPNPFNPATTINYQLPQEGLVTLKIFDVLGKEITVLVDEFKNKGSYNLTFNGGELAGGVYLYQLKVNDFVLTKKLVLLK